MRHKESVSKFSKLDFEAIEKVTYLYEFDRAVQYVVKFRLGWGDCANERTGPYRGDTLPSRHIIGTHHRATQFWPSVFLTLRYRLRTTR